MVPSIHRAPSQPAVAQHSPRGKNLESRTERFLYRFFRVSLWVKLLVGIGEFMSAAVLFFTPPGWWTLAAQKIANSEIFQDTDIITSAQVLHEGSVLSQHTPWFATVYLLIHALTKIVLVWAVLKNKLWAYPWMLGILTIFTGYQIFDIATGGSLIMVALTVFDVLIVFLTLHEWKRAKRNH